MKNNKGFSGLKIIAFLMLFLIIIGGVAQFVEYKETQKLRDYGKTTEVVIEETKKHRSYGRRTSRTYYKIYYNINNTRHNEQVNLSEYNKLNQGDKIQVCHYQDTARYNFTNCADTAW